MLVAFSNVVKVESVPLNSDEFSPMRPSGGTPVPHTATMRFNPPPNWPPAPPGWTPPPGWAPDPSWPPPPPGWSLWVPDSTRRKTGIIIGALAVTLLIGVGAVIAVVATSGHLVTGSATHPAGTELSDEDQVRDVVDRFERSWNESDFDAMSEILCEDMRNDPEFDPGTMSRDACHRRKVDAHGRRTRHQGRRGDGHHPEPGEDPDDIDFTRENGEWKWCEF